MIFLNNSKVRSRVLLMSLIAFGLYLRFAQLNARPLNQLESATALQALNFASGRPDYSVSQPLYVAITALLFRLLGTSNFVARLFSAVCGVLILFFPFLYRNKIHLSKLTFLTVFIAVDPMLITWSIQADGMVPFIALSLYGLYFLSVGRKKTGIVFIGLSIALGIRAFPFIFALFLTMPILALIDTLWFSTGVHPLKFLTNTLNRREWLLMAAVIVLAATGFFAFPSGINGLGNAVQNTFAIDTLDKHIFRLGIGPLLIAVILYLLIPIVISLIAARYKAEASNYQSIIALIGIAVVGAILLLLGQGILTLVYLIVPLLFIASDSVLIENKISPLDLNTVQTLASVLIPFLGFFLLQRFAEIAQLRDLTLPLTIRWQNQAYTLPVSRLIAYVVIIGIGILIMTVLIPMILRSFNPQRTKIGIYYGIFILIGLNMIHNSWTAACLNPGGDSRQIRATPQQQSLLLGRMRYVVSGEFASVVNEIGQKSAGFFNRLSGINLIQDDPMLDWALRDYREIKKSSMVPKGNTDFDLLVSDPTAEIPIKNGYVGMITDWSAAANWDKLTAADWLFWLLYKNQPEKRTQIVIWQPTSYLTTITDKAE